MCTEEIASKMSIIHGKKLCKNGFKPSQKTFYSDGIRLLVDCLEKYIEKHDNCIEYYGMSNCV